MIARFNETFGLELTESDALHLDAIRAEMTADTSIQQQAGVNSEASFENPFRERFVGTAVDQMKAAEDLTYRLLDDDTFQSQMRDWMMPQVYAQARVGYQQCCPVGDLLARGEDRHLERKSTLRWDLRSQAKSKVLEGVVVKTVAGFLNSADGGTLLVGVADDGALVGLEHDYATLRKPGKDDADLFQLHLTQLLVNGVGAAAAANVTTDVHTVDSRDLCRVHVRPSGHPVTARVKTSQGPVERFFVRLGNGTRSIDEASEVERYIAQRWHRR